MNNRVDCFKKFMGFSISAWFNAALSLVSTPLITRLFSPDEIGKINIFITIVNLILNFTYLGIDQAFTRFFYEPLKKNSKESLLGICLLVTCLIATVIALFIFIFGKILSTTVLGYVTYIVPVSLCVCVFSNVIMRYVNHYARMQNNIVLFNVQAIAITVISNVSYITAIIYRANAETAIIVRTLFTGVAGVVFFYQITKIVEFRDMYIDKSIIKTIIGYALPICPAAILSVANNSIGQLLMKHYVSYEIVGIYSNAVTIASIITLIQSGINHYWEPLVYENYKTKQPHIIKIHHMISFIMIAFALCIIFCQDLIYALLVGKSFWGSKQIFPLVIISPVCYTIAETLGVGIKLSKKTLLNIPIYLINLIVNVSLCVVLLPKIGVVGAALSSATSSIVMLVVKSILGERVYRCSDNYYKLTISLITLYMTGIVHTHIYEAANKYLLYTIAVIIVVTCYKKEVKSLFILMNDLKKGFVRRVFRNE